MLVDERMTRSARTVCLLVATFAAPLGCADDPNDEFEEVSGDADGEKDDGSRLLEIRDRLEWPGQKERVTKVFRTAAQFQSFFDEPPPAELDFAEETVIYFSSGVQSSGGYDASILSVRLSATRKTLTIGAETKSPGQACITTQVLTTPGTLVSVKKLATQTNRFQTRHSEFAVHCKAVCGDELVPQLAYGARDALYYSESDEPFEAFHFDKPAPEALTKAGFLALIERSASTNIDEEKWDEWIKSRTEVDADADDYEKELARQYAELRAIIELQLTDIRVYEVGSDGFGNGVFPLYIVGRTACGGVAGYKTKVVAT